MIGSVTNLQNPTTETPAADKYQQWSQHVRWLRTVVLARLRSVDGVADILQEVYLALHKSDSIPETPVELARWLHRVAVRQTLLHRRRLGRQRRRELVYAARNREVIGDGSPVDQMFMDECREQLWRAIRQLPSADAEILLLKYSEDWTYHQLAERLGIRVEAVKLRLHRARAKMRALMDAACHGTDRVGPRG